MMHTPRARTFAVFAAFLILSTASARRKDSARLQGRVALADGSLPMLLVPIEQVCKGVIETTTFADSEGRFTLPAGSDVCEVRANLPGFRSQSVPARPDLGTLVLRPRGNKESAWISQKNNDLAKNKLAWKALVQGLDAAAKGKWRSAEESFHDATIMARWAPSPFLCLGILQEREADPVAAKKSYKEAIQTAPGFLLPYVYAASLEVTRGDWQEALNDSNKVIAIDPQGFPGVWLANAWANLNVHQTELAEKSAREGIKLDVEHRFPELEYVLGLVMTDKADNAGALEHFKQYLALDPHGPRAEAARAEIANRTAPSER